MTVTSDRSPGRRDDASGMRVRRELAALEGRIEGDVIHPDSPEFASVRRPAWAQYEHVRPEAVVRCRTPTDIAESLAVVRRLGLEVAPRGGGHCFAGRSATRGLVIDLSAMSSVAVSNGVATVGAGGRLGEIDERLATDALAIPAGSCPAVGIAGLTLGGGLGFLGRKYGLTSDQLVQAQVVLADGRVIECDERRDQSLFWALRGAGAGQFGVVTKFVFRTVPAPEVTCFRLAWPPAKTTRLIEIWQSWAPSAPDELAASLLLNVPRDPEQPATTTLFGACLAAEDETKRLLDRLVVRAGADPTSASVEQLQYTAAKRYLWEHAPGAEPSAASPAGDEPPSALAFSKSEFFGCELPRAAIAALVDRLTARRAPGQPRELDFTPWGGAYTRLDSEATAFPHRHERFVLKHAVSLDSDASTQQLGAAREWLGRSWELIHPFGSGGVFPNFADPELADLATAYYGPNRDRLIRIKAQYDAEDLFRSPAHEIAAG
jgi:FAD/FMN-containing dehydrogenase